MKDTLDGDYAREYLTSALADADKGNDELSGNAYNRVIDMEWVEMIEGKLPYIEKAIDEQRKFIEEYKEVDRIDKVKQVGKDAVQHRHTAVHCRQSDALGTLIGHHVKVGRCAAYHRAEAYHSVVLAADSHLLSRQRYLESAWNQHKRKVITVAAVANEAVFGTRHKVIYYEIIKA
jgi:hypothetical protein